MEINCEVINTDNLPEILSLMEVNGVLLGTKADGSLAPLATVVLPTRYTEAASPAKKRKARQRKERHALGAGLKADFAVPNSHGTEEVSAG